MTKAQRIIELCESSPPKDAATFISQVVAMAKDRINDGMDDNMRDALEVIFQDIDPSDFGVKSKMSTDALFDLALKHAKTSEMFEGATFDKIFKAFGNQELTVPQGKRLITAVYTAFEQKLIDGTQRDAVLSVVRAAESRGENFKFGNALNKIYDNDKAAELFRKTLAG